MAINWLGNTFAKRGKFMPDYDYEDDNIDGVGFARPGENSSLRRATKDNPRRHPCPTCKRPNMLTDIDKARHYQCDSCADRAESGCDYDYDY
jgi:hypothetical protein